MSARIITDQLFCAAQVRCEGTPIRRGSGRKQRTICVPCERHLEQREAATKLRGARDRFTKADGRRRTT